MIFYNGHPSDEFGVVVEHRPDYGIPQRKHDVVSVPGRSGDLLIPQDAYENIQREYEIFFPGAPGKASRDVAKWLMSPQTYARLEDDYDPDVYRMAYFYGPMDVSTVLDRFGKCTIKFGCKPQRFLKSGEDAVTLTSPGRLVNPTVFGARPLIRVFGSAGVLEVGDTEITISAIDGYVDIDCDVQDAYKGSVNKNATITLSEFPVLGAATDISWTGSITGVVVVPRWWSL